MPEADALQLELSWQVNKEALLCEVLFIVGTTTMKIVDDDTFKEPTALVSKVFLLWNLSLSEQEI